MEHLGDAVVWEPGRERVLISSRGTVMGALDRSLFWVEPEINCATHLQTW